MSSSAPRRKDTPVDAVSSLVTDLVNAINICQIKVEEVDDDLETAVVELLELYRRHAAQLMELYNEGGAYPDESAAPLAAVDAAVAQAGTPEETRVGSPRGEIAGRAQRLCDAYDAAAGMTQQRNEIHRLICDQRDALRDKVDKLFA